MIPRHNVSGSADDEIITADDLFLSRCPEHGKVAVMDVSAFLSAG